MQAVPVMGAILLNAAMDKCLLVRGFKEHAAWGFPRGKISKDETDAECAVREVHSLALHACCMVRVPCLPHCAYPANSPRFSSLAQGMCPCLCSAALDTYTKYKGFP